MPTISAVGDDAGEAGADLRLHLGDHRRQRVAVVRIARQRLHVGDELADLGAMERGGDRHFDAELIGPMRFALGRCIQPRRMQRIDLLAALLLT